ncbi:hypothetical protein ACJMK2_033897 [Sinanodonta woodiana]|uniref:Uncharacterized protein n=1 Tax=Sinanodonta woodiana TaxID=1069815 RepID=A0ABD3WTD4_SINWO
MEVLIPEQSLNKIRGLSVNIISGRIIRSQARRNALLLILDEGAFSNNQRRMMYRRSICTQLRKPPSQPVSNINTIKITTIRTASENPYSNGITTLETHLNISVNKNAPLNITYEEALQRGNEVKTKTLEVITGVQTNIGYSDQRKNYLGYKRNP